MTKAELQREVDSLDFAPFTKFSFIIMILTRVVTNILIHLIEIEDRIENLKK